jgi:pimeloyl-ACP methyl ester carboxylesterase
MCAAETYFRSHLRHFEKGLHTIRINYCLKRLIAMTIPTLPGITPQTITTSRLTTRVLFTGAQDGIPVLFIHGNASSATYWEETMLALPPQYRGIAPDQRGYGDADRSQKIDATRGMGDLAADAIALLDHLHIQRAHVVGHSLGGSVIWQLLIDHPERFLTVTLAAPGSPFGFGGTKDVDGTPHWSDFAGSGGGVVNPQFAQAMAAGDRGTDNPQASPRNVMNNFYWKPPFKPAREEDLLSSLLSEHVGEREYPGDLTTSPNWPGVAPGVWGPANALSPKYVGDFSRIYAINPKPKILWIRGDSDQIVSDQSLFDLGTLGALGAIPGYPGTDVYPSQPMVSQIRAALEKYQAAGGQYTELVLAECGHTPYIEKPDAFNRAFHAHLAS